jgi:uncharacterized protein YraI
MSKTWLVAAAACAVVAGLPTTGSAQVAQALINAPANLRAGPARDYPLVAQLAAGTPVTVMGCVAGYSWCDIALPDLRGWVYAGRLNYAYQGGYVPLLNYGVTLGVPVVTFTIGAYWDSYYRGRPWYGNRGRWINHPPPPMPRPSARPLPPPRPMPAPGPAMRPGGPGPGARPGGPGPGAGPGPRPAAGGPPARPDRGPGPGRQQDDRGQRNDERKPQQ